MSDRGFTEGMRIVNGSRFFDSADGFLIESNNDSPASSSDFVANVWNIMDSAGNLLIKKHKDYGPTNISRSPGGPLNGLRVRMWDKTARINHLIDNGATPENESLRDSFIDLLNYAAIAMMVIDGTWPKE